MRPPPSEPSLLAFLGGIDSIALTMPSKPGTQIATAMLVVLTIVLILILSCGEVMRRRGDITVGFAEQYATPSAILTPYNLWSSERSIGGDPPYPDMEAHFPDHKVLRDEWEAVRDEALRVCQEGLASKIRGDRYFRRIADDKWKKFYLKWYGDILPEARELCPKTCALLDRLPDVHLAMFSILEPGSVIPPHGGPFKGCLRYHLGLQCPADRGATIKVDGKPYSWADGEDVLFDDTYIHEVENPTDETRIILFCDVERKLDTPQAQAVNHWVCQKLGPFSNKVNNKREKKEEAS